MLRGPSGHSDPEDMLKPLLKYVGKNEDCQLLVFEPPEELTGIGVHKTAVAIPVLPREGGSPSCTPFLALPETFLSNDAVLDAAMSKTSGLLGPSKDFSAPLLEEDENGEEAYVTSTQSRFLLIDVADAALDS